MSERCHCGEPMPCQVCTVAIYTAPAPVGEARCPDCGAWLWNSPCCGRIAALRAENERLNTLLREAIQSDEHHVAQRDRYRRALEQARERVGDILMELQSNRAGGVFAIGTMRGTAGSVLAIIDAALEQQP